MIFVAAFFVPSSTKPYGNWVKGAATLPFSFFLSEIRRHKQLYAFLSMGLLPLWLTAFSPIVPESQLNFFVVVKARYFSTRKRAPFVHLWCPVCCCQIFRAAILTLDIANTSPVSPFTSFRPPDFIPPSSKLQIKQCRRRRRRCRLRLTPTNPFRSTLPTLS